MDETLLNCYIILTNGGGAKKIEKRRGREIRYELVKYSEPVGEGAHSVGTKEVGARVLGERSHARQQG